MKEHGGDLLHMILDGDGHIYVCGDVSMAADVFRTLQVKVDVFCIWFQNQ